MGSRICKALGYGAELKVTDFLVEDYYEYELKDVNAMEKEDIKKIINTVNYKNFLKELTGLENVPSYHYNRLDIVPELRYVGGEHTIGVVVTMYPDWHRFDNAIDYYGSESMVCEIKELHTSDIYPLSGTYICERNCVSGKKGDRLQGGDYNQRVGRWDENLDAWAEGEILESYLKDWRVTPHPSLCLSVYLSHLVQDKIGFLKTLTPSLATWWS